MAPVLIYFAYNGFVTERKQEETTVTTTSPLEDVIETDRWEKSIAVLPFANMSDDPGNEYFSDGLTEEILTLLAKTRGLKVIGRTSSFAFKGKNEDLRDTGHALGVKTILEGSVRIRVAGVPPRICGPTRRFLRPEPPLITLTMKNLRRTV